MKELLVENFPNGLVTDIESKSIPRGSASSILNWEHKEDHIELRRGMLLVGSEITGTGLITGIHTTRNAVGTEITYISKGKKVLYYDTVTEDWIEVGTDILGTDGDGEEVSFSSYVTTQGYQLWFSSPSSSLFKIMTANPGSYTDMYDASKNFKGKIDIILNRMFLWGRNKDKAGIYGSHIDTLANTTITDESIDTGDGGKTYSGTLAFKAGDIQRTCFAIVANDEDSNETFVDNFDGTLTGSAGGTGTINYTSGVITLTFFANVTIGKDIRATYQWEDSTTNGIADFTESATRLASEGFIFRQDVGGDAQNVKTYNDIQYCLHQFNTWRLNIGVDDTEATNRIYRELAGIPNWRASVATGDGIYFIDDSDNANPTFRILTLESAGTDVVPVEISKDLDLSGYVFDKGACISFEDTIRFACRTSGSTINNREFVYNKKHKAWYITDYQVSCYAINNGALWAGDSITDNVYELLSGFDDDDSTINNLWEGKFDNLDINNLKKTKRLVLQGLIQKDQSYKVYLDFDNSGFIEVGEIRGDGTYVDLGQAVTVGSVTIGKKVVGGGGTATAFNYVKELKINTDKFREVKIKFIAQEIGFVSVSMLRYKDIREKSARVPSKYR